MTTKRIPNKQNTCDICEGRHYHKDCKPIEKQQKIHDDRHYYEFEREDKNTEPRINKRLSLNMKETKDDTKDTAKEYMTICIEIHGGTNKENEVTISKRQRQLNIIQNNPYRCDICYGKITELNGRYFHNDCLLEMEQQHQTIDRDVTERYGELDRLNKLAECE